MTMIYKMSILGDFSLSNVRKLDFNMETMLSKWIDTKNMTFGEESYEDIYGSFLTDVREMRSKDNLIFHK